MTGSGVTLSGTLPNVVISGSVTSLGGSVIGGALTVDGTLTVAADASVGGQLQVPSTGTLRLQPNATANATLTVATGASNDGLIELTTSNASAGTVTLAVTSGAFTNGATGVVNALQGSASGVRTLDAAIVNQGTLAAVDNDLTIDNTGSTFTTPSGTLSVAAGQLLTVQRSITEFGSGTQLLGTGTIRLLNLGAPHVLRLLSDFTYPAGGPALDLSGQGAVFVQGPGSFIVQGNQVFWGDEFTAPLIVQGQVTASFVLLSDTLDVQAGGTLRVQPQGSENSARLDLSVNGFTNSGTIELTSDAASTGTVTLGVAADSLVNGSTGTIQALAGGAPGVRVIDALVRNEGAISAVDNALQFTGSGFGDVDGALLQGGDTLDFTATTVTAVSGVLRPGTSMGVVDSLSVAGDLTLNSVSDVDIELAGTAAGQFDVLTVSGTCSLDGALNVSTIGYTPTSGDSFTVMTCGSLQTGTTFASPPAGWIVSYTTTEVVLQWP